MTEQPLTELLDDVLRKLIQELKDASEPADKAQLAVAIRNLQTARNEGLTGGGLDPLSQLGDAALNETETPQ